MTALKEYARLESVGLWRAAPGAKHRDVVISFGNATLVIADKAGRALAHWSLPAVERLNPGAQPALFGPDAEGSETLEIDDPYMIGAIEKVRRALSRQRPRPGRLRWLGLGLSAAAVAALCVFWLPDAFLRRTLDAVPAAKRSEIGATLLGHIQRVTGTACRSPLGSQALSRLEARVLGSDAPGQIVVLPSDALQALYLPGGIVALSRTVVETHEDPAVAAGYVAAAVAGRTEQDPLEDILRTAGLGTTLHLFTTGGLPAETLPRYAELLLSDPPERPDAATLLPVFAAAELPTTPYAYALDATGQATLRLIEADPMAGRTAPLVLSDGDWVSLQGICGA